MTYLLCRNRVSDFSKWKAIFASHAEAHKNAGLHLLRIAQAVDEPNNVFFLFEVSSKEKAQEFISNPGAADAAKASAVLDGEYHFVEDAGGY
jgi:hypothetical protein